MDEQQKRVVERMRSAKRKEYSKTTTDNNEIVK
jgi:hypothetical protein